MACRSSGIKSDKMQAVLESLDKLSKISRFLQPEQTLMSSINKLDPFLVTGIQQQDLNLIESKLLALFAVNKGSFSIQCALAIAKKLLRVYELSKNQQFFDLFSLVISQTTTTTVVAVGYIVKFIGQHTKSQLPRLVEHLLKQPQNLDFSVVYALRYVFKTCSKTVEKYVQKAFQYAKKAVALPRQTTITACMKLFKSLLQYTMKCNPPASSGITVNEVIEVLRQTLKDDHFPVIKNEIASLLAYCAYIPISKSVSSSEQAEWAIGQIKESNKTIFAKPLDEIAKFPAIKDMTIMHFIDLITPEMIVQDHATLFKFIRNNSVANLPRIIPMLPEEVRNTTFAAICKEKPSPIQLHLLIMLCPNNGSITEAANAAVNLACDTNKLFRRAAIDFFVSFSKEQPTTANTFLGQSLKFLVENQAANDNLIRGHSYIAKAVLGNLIAADISISEHRETINQLITMLQSSNIKQPFFAGVFHVLSVLPEEFGQREDINTIIKNTVPLIKGSSKAELRSLKALLVFRTAFPENETNKTLLTKALSLFSKLPIPVVKALCSLVPSVLPNTPQALAAAEKVIERTKVLKISTDLIKNFIKHPLPTGLDLLKLPTPLTPQQIRDQAVLEKIIRAFPELYASTTTDGQKTLFEELMSMDMQVPIAKLYVLAICQSKYSNLLPKTALNRFTQQANTNNFSQSQLSSECVGAYLALHPASIGNVLSFVEQLQTMSGCLLINAIASYNVLNHDSLLRAIIYIDCKVKEPKLMAFALSALSSICTNNSMDMQDLGLVANQLAVIFQALQTTTALQPVIAYLLAEAFSVLLEITSIELSNGKQLNDYIRLIIDSINLMPITFAREAYFTISKALFTFAFSLSEYAPIHFPTTIGTPTALQLSACDAFSIYAEFKAIDFNITEIIIKALTLLQKTGDKRASAFVQALASSSNDLAFWISHIRRILLTSSLYDSQVASIEPTPEVKKCCLEVSQILLVKLAKETTLKTEFLDDIISSACKATETNLLQLQIAAFPLLQKVIELFRTRKSEEGNNILDLYDSQFKQAVRVGFTLDLTVSGKFLYTYLSFNTENMSKTATGTSILDVYVTGLTACKQRTSEYFSLATHLCTSARRDPAILEAIKDYLETLTPVFADIVKHSMELYKDKSDWRATAKFRNLASSFYQELLPAFVWLQERTKTIIPIPTLISFFLIELHLTREKWVSSASFDAITIAFRFCGKEIPLQLIELTLRSIVPFFSNVSTQQISEFLLSCGRAIKPSETANNLRLYTLSLVLQYSFNVKTIAYILKNDVECILAPFLPKISACIVESVNEGKTSMQEASALYSLIFYHYPNSVSAVILDSLSLQSKDIESVFDIIDNGIAAFQGSFPIDAIARFCIATFRRGGMLLIARALIKRPEVGVALLSLGGAKSTIIMCLNDFSNIILYLRFLELCVETCSKFETIIKPFTVSIVKLCSKLIVQYGNDIMNGHQTVQQCVQLLRASEKVLGDEFVNVIDEIDSFDRTDVMQMIETHIAKANLKKKSQKLATFSSNTRSKKTDEWQSLELSGSSDED